MLTEQDRIHAVNLAIAELLKSREEKQQELGAIINNETAAINAKIERMVESLDTVLMDGMTVKRRRK